MNKKNFTFLGILLGLSISILMQTLIVTALPAVIDELGDIHLYGWVISSYMLASIVTTPLFSKIADILGFRILYFFGLTIFMVGSFLSGIANSMISLVAFRILMGMGVGAVIPASLGAIPILFSEESRGKAFGIIGTFQLVASAAGPILGGWITSDLGWRWGFFLTTPICIVSMLIVSFGKKQILQIPKGWLKKVDWKGAVFLGGGLGLSLPAIEEVMSGGTYRYFGIIAIIVSLVLFAAAIKQAKRHPSPAFPIPLLRKGDMGRAAMGTLFVGIVSYGLLAYFPLLIQTFWGGSAKAIGLSLWPILLATGLGSGLGGWLSDKFFRLQISSIGWLLSGIGVVFLILAVANMNSGITTYSTLYILGIPVYIQIIVSLIGFGIGLTLPYYLLIAQKSANPEEQATASGIIQLARHLGGAIAVPLLAIWLSNIGDKQMKSGLISIFVTLAVIIVLGLFSSFQLNRRSREKYNDF